MTSLKVAIFLSVPKIQITEPVLLTPLLPPTTGLRAVRQALQTEFARPADGLVLDN